jgi:hypothetical protein
LFISRSIYSPGTKRGRIASVSSLARSLGRMSLSLGRKARKAAGNAGRYSALRWDALLFVALFLFLFCTVEEKTLRFGRIRRLVIRRYLVYFFFVFGFFFFFFF